jgi:hypothetical protein
VDPQQTSFARQQLGKQVSMAMDIQATIQDLLEKMFSVWSIQTDNKRREPVNWGSVGSWAVKRGLWVCCSTVIFGVCNSVRLSQFPC